MAEGGIPGEGFYITTQPNLLAETGILATVNVVKRIYTNVNRVYHVGSNTKGKHRYLGDRAVGGRVEGS